MIDNVTKCKQILMWLEQWGCQEVVLCAGARNAPLVMALSHTTGLKVWSFFEERAAAFFALGRMKSNLAPVAVVTTSGTAAAELLPAAIEAYYTGLPLLLITADRPPEYRGKGAPQSIEQVGLFSSYVEKSLDYGTETREVFWSRQKPLHLNVCFTEPSKEQLAQLEVIDTTNFAPQAPTAEVADYSAQDAAEICQAFCQRSRHPLVVVGPLPESATVQVEEWLKSTRLPVYMEALSNLSHRPALQEQKIRGGERVLQAAFAQGWADGVIRIGGVPTTRLWRDLETNLQHTPVISFNQQPFSGLSRRDAQILPLKALTDWPANAPANNLALWQQLQLKAESTLHQLLREFPQSEPGLLAGLASQIPKGAKVYLGNSLPIREWDLVATGMKDWQMAGNRGANGIDGQLSSFLGFAEEEESNWCVVGDLTTLYDLSAPWVLNQRHLRDLNIVIINNGGGKIFSRMYGQDILENHHRLQFMEWAKMWGLSYIRSQQNEPFSHGTQPQVIELVPDEEQNNNFWSAWDLFWNSL